jgi:hypothetical protein
VIKRLIAAARALIALLVSCGDGQPETKAMTTSTTPKTTPAASGGTVQSMVTDLSTLGTQINAFGAAIQSAFKAKFGDVGSDTVAAVDAAEVVTEAAIFILGSSTGLSEALTIEKLIVMLAPEAVPALELVASLIGKMHIQPAIPGASPEDGGYPQGATGGRTGR